MPVLWGGERKTVIIMQPRELRGCISRAVSIEKVLRAPFTLLEPFDPGSKDGPTGRSIRMLTQSLPCIKDDRIRMYWLVLGPCRGFGVEKLAAQVALCGISVAIGHQCALAASRPGEYLVDVPVRRCRLSEDGFHGGPKVVAGKKAGIQTPD
jgi:hypothetical protein